MQLRLPPGEASNNRAVPQQLLAVLIGLGGPLCTNGWRPRKGAPLIMPAFESGSFLAGRSKYTDGDGAARAPCCVRACAPRAQMGPQARPQSHRAPAGYESGAGGVLVRRPPARHWAASCRWKDEDRSKPRPRTTGNTALGREAAGRLSAAPRSHPRSARRVDELRTRPRVDAAAAHARPPVMATKLSLSPGPPGRTPKGGFKVRQRRLGRADTMERVDGESLSVVAPDHAGTPTAKDLLMRAVASTWPKDVATQDWSSPAASPPSSPAAGRAAGSPLVKLRGVSLGTSGDNPCSPIRALDLGVRQVPAPRPSSASRLHGWDADSEELQERAEEIFKLPESRREREWRRQEADRRRREAARAEREREEAERRRIELARQLEKDLERRRAAWMEQRASEQIFRERMTDRLMRKADVAGTRLQIEPNG